MIIISTVKKSGVPTNALVIPEGFGIPKLATMFANTYGVTEIPFEIIGKPTSANSALEDLGSLTTAPTIDYSECTSFQGITANCYALTTIDFSSADPTKLTATSWREGFGATALEMIINMPVNESLTNANTYYQTFLSTSSLKDISFQGKIGANIDFKGCAFSGSSPLLNIAFALSETNTATVTFKTGTVGTIMSNAHCRLNEAGDGLETCNAGDDGDLGTISQYITNKGWTITYA